MAYGTRNRTKQEVPTKAGSSTFWVDKNDTPYLRTSKGTDVPLAGGGGTEDPTDFLALVEGEQSVNPEVDYLAIVNA